LLLHQLQVDLDDGQVESASLEQKLGTHFVHPVNQNGSLPVLHFQLVRKVEVLERVIPLGFALLEHIEFFIADQQSALRQIDDWGILVGVEGS